MPNSNPKIAFFGTPEAAVEILHSLEKGGVVPSLIITNPDKPQGRKLIPTPSPVKIWAEAEQIPYETPENLDEDFEKKMREVEWDLFIVVAYGKIMPKNILAIPKHGSINVHYSLLPKYRGASPIESQILADDKHPGISLMLLDEKMDRGPILTQAEVKIENWPPKTEELRQKSNDLAGKLLVEILPKYLAGEITPQIQDGTKATYAKKFTKESGLIDLTGDPYQNYLKFQALGDRPGTYFFLEKGDNPIRTDGASPTSNGARKIRLIIKDAIFKDPIRTDGASPTSNGAGSFEILRVIPEGKKEMNYKDFLAGLR